MVRPIDPTNPFGPRTAFGYALLGDEANYTRFSPQGHQTMVAEAKPWVDVLIEPTARTTGANAPTFEKWFDDAAGTSRGVYLYSFDDAVGGSEKEVFSNMQMPHGWDGGSVYLHVHWVGDTNDDPGAPYWGLEYVWKEPGGTYGDTAIIVTDGYNYAGDTATGTVVAGLHYMSKFSALAPGTTADGVSSILIGRLVRGSADANDSYSGKCGLLYMDAHVQLSQLGSTEAY